ncbi:MAG TPA: hypothetical protein VN222_00755, partial [Novosphingobium sp.]|nr:hypothetical protein [Novosphingobium sp.]
PACAQTRQQDEAASDATASAAASTAEAASVGITGTVTTDEAGRTHIPAHSASIPAGAPSRADMWAIDVSGGYSTRDSGPKGAFAAAALTRQLGRTYVRAALTGYRSTVNQTDMALPSTYVVGSLGVGGNYNNWVFDAWASYGWQHYGQIESAYGARASTTSSGSPYISVGGDAGRILQVTPRLFLTPTVSVSYAYDRLLRPSYDTSLFPDFQSSEPAWTGVAALRLDQKVGASGQHYIGLAASWHVTNNATSIVLMPDHTFDGTIRTMHFADGWGEVAGNINLRLTDRVRLQATVVRSFDALAGNATTVGGGLRFGF